MLIAASFDETAGWRPRFGDGSGEGSQPVLERTREWTFTACALGGTQPSFVDSGREDVTEPPAGWL
jgi:hypothetical protein